MALRSEFLLQLLQKMGAPLMGAVLARANEDGDDQKEATILASLLSESVKVGISLSQSMNLKADDGDADAIRVALSTLAAGMVADNYRLNGRIPAGNDANKIAKILESVIVFADNFAPAAEHAPRLQTLEKTPPFFDPAQTSIYTIHALLPAISAIADFSFGESETRLVQDVAARLERKAAEFQGGGLSAASGKMGELVALQALALLYAECHRAETRKLQNAGTEASSNTGLEAVWASFDRRSAMVGALLSSMAGAPNASGGGSGGVKPAAPATEPEKLDAPAAPPAGGTPMSFFKKK